MGRLKLTAAMATFTIFVAVIPSAFAATVLNVDAEARNVIITEKGVRSDVEVAPNVTLNICANGCFALFPSGLVLPLKGNETLEIKDSDGVLLSTSN